MKPVDVVLGALTLAAIGLGYAAYRAWNPQPEAIQPDVSSAVDTRPATLQRSRDRAYGEIPVDAVRIWTGTTSECSHGILLWHGPKGTTVVTMDGQPVACLQPVPKLVRK
ncbi:hypothetical protein [Dyella sp. LX-1]|uniref:hypothetical protein n=1 Tax=Dyella sp. LX-1 TaxID=2838831 RepID=UPI001BE0DA03|nr:hypothetical protein [Dyella sp. LX-1]MBT2119857.1 hypothetical protein [Dyella sp. LX-1]MBT2119868.1 hypothetical protein [Dyella sp. LX-1]